MVTPRNDSIELSTVKEKQRPLPSAPPGEYFNGASVELGSGQRSTTPRKRCWTVVTLVVVVLVAIGAGTIVFYEHLTGRLPAESSNGGHGPLPEVSTDYKVVTEHVPGLSDPFPEESSQRSVPSTTEVIFIDSTTEESIYVDSSKEESVENSSVDLTSSQDPDFGSGDVSDHDPRESSEEYSYGGEGSGSGSGDDSEA